jgi:hypothetical protein
MLTRVRVRAELPVGYPRQALGRGRWKSWSRTRGNLVPMPQEVLEGLELVKDLCISDILHNQFKTG